MRRRPSRRGSASPSRCAERNRRSCGPPQSKPTDLKRIEFSSADLSEVREFLDATYGWRVRFRHPDTTGAPVTVSMVDAGMLLSAHASAPGDLSYRVNGDDFVVIDTLLEGAFELEHKDRTDRYTAGDVYIANYPDASFRSRTHDIRVLTTILPISLLAEQAGTNSDLARPLRFSSCTPVKQRGQRWRAASLLVDRLCNDPEVGAAPLVTGPAARLLAALALLTFPNTAAATPTGRDRRDAHPDTLRRAIAFIEANPGRDITVADIAAAAHVTARAVQLAFRRHLDTTPTAYLRQVRLSHVHQQLQDADPSAGLTVSRAALDWGFVNPGRFARRYREAYGELPSDTLAQ